MNDRESGPDGRVATQAYDPDQMQRATKTGSPMKELVVGVDGSDQSRSALRWAAGLAAAVPIELRVVEAWTGGDRYTADQVSEQVKAELAEYSRAALEGLTPEPQIEFEVLHGGPAETLLKRVTADSGLVLGSRGRGGFLGLLLGSVSRACIEHAPCPVMIVRQQVPPPIAGSNILVGHDGSPGARLALEWAVALARPIQAKVIAAYAWQAGASEVRPALHDRLAKEATSSIEAWAGEVSAEVQPIEIEGEPRMELVKLAERYHAGLVVVGRRGKGVVRALRMGSVASYLVTSSPVPIAVTPPPAGTEPS
jgi:nucleotide-binding universal stress UspA family protein